MLGQKNHLTTELVTEAPVVLLLLEQESDLSRFLTAFFEDHNFLLKKVFLKELKSESEARIFYQELMKLNLYRVVVLTGFNNHYCLDFDFLKQVLTALQEAFVEDGSVLPLSFLLNYSSPLKSFNLNLSPLNNWWLEQNNCLNYLLKKFPQANFCLLEDYLAQDVLAPYFELVFAGFKKGQIFDWQKDCFWQNQASLLNLLPRLMFQSRQGDKYLLRGRRQSANEGFNQLQKLSSRYLQKDLKTIRPVTEVNSPQKLLNDFVVVYEDNSQALELLDHKIRHLPHSLELEFNFNENSLAHLKSQKAAFKNNAQQLSLKSEKQLKLPHPITQKDKEKAGVQLQQESLIKKRPVTLTTETVEEKVKTIERKEKNTDKPIKNEENHQQKEPNLDQKIQKIFKEQQGNARNQRFNKNLKEAKNIVRSNKKRKLFFYFGSVIFSLASVCLLFLASFFIGQQQLKTQSLNLIEKQLAGESLTRKTNKRLIYQVFNWQLKQGNRWLGEDQLSTANKYLRLFNLLEEGVELSQQQEDFNLQLYRDVWQSNGDLVGSFTEFLNIKEGVLKNQRALAQTLDSFNLDILNQKTAQQLSDFSQENLKNIKEKQRQFLFWQTLKPLLISQARSNLVLLIQDNAELRSTGGYPTALLTFAFESGHLLDWQVYAIDDLNSRVYGKKLASDELSRLFSSEQLDFSQANWEADFKQSAQEISWFVEQSLSIKPDLLLTVNSQALQELVGELGSLNLGSQIINQQNFYSLLQSEAFSYVELVAALVRRSQQLNQEELNALSTWFFKLLEEKESFAYSEEVTLANVLAANVWTGEILETPCPNDFSNNGDCFLDGIYQVENNIGLNKVNRLLTEKITHSLGLSENFVRHKRSVVWQNLARQNYWPEGDYQAYLKFYLPLAARIEKLSLGTEVLDSGQYQLESRAQHQLLTLRLRVKANSEQSLELIYLIPHDLQEPFSYVFLDQKQAGIFNKETTYRVLFAESFQPELIAPAAIYENKVIEFENKNDNNFLFAVAF